MSSIEKLLELMAQLRSPTGGCPWDREQDFASIAPYTLEEAYEVADAIARDDLVALEDELGDLLFQVVFHAQMAAEAGHFDFEDVAAGIVDKMRRRHPHVFGNEEQRTAGPVSGSWERIKGEERGDDGDGSALDGIARALPALKRAQKLGKRAAGVGFDWESRKGVRDKICEELDELEVAAGSRDQARITEEFGDLLFAVVNLARHLDVDAEQALSVANSKFESRFRDMEQALDARGASLSGQTMETLDQLWRAAKHRVG